MALVPQDVADALNAAGIDDRTKLAAFVEFSGSLVQRSRKLAEIDRLKAERSVEVQAVEAQIQALTAEVDQIDVMLRGR